ncbi:MAG TPA: MBL fold metallo-hydrolase [Ktedonobacteraceae bacterium]
MQQFLLLPEQARPIADPAEGYRLQKVGDAGYVVISGIVQSSFVVTSAGVVVVDAPPALAEKIPAAIKCVTDQLVTHFIYTHSHYDHVGSASRFPGAELIAHAETARILAVHADPERPLPTRTFEGEQMTLEVGDETIELRYPGPNHDTGNILVYAPRHRLAQMSDIVMPGWAPYRGWGNADYPPGILLAHDAILAVDFDTYVGGHVYRTGTRKDVEESREFFLDLWHGTLKAMGEVLFDDYAAQVEPGNAWAAQTIWFDAVANQVTAQLVAKWKDRLGGVDTFTHDTVIAAIISISTDAPKHMP